MRFMSFLDPEGEPRLGVSVDGVVHDVTHAVPAGRTTGLSPMRHLLSRETDLGEVAAAAAGSPVARIAHALPVVPDPTKIVAAPVNYRDHQHEMTADAAVDGAAAAADAACASNWATLIGWPSTVTTTA